MSWRERCQILMFGLCGVSMVSAAETLNNESGGAELPVRDDADLGSYLMRPFKVILLVSDPS